MDVEFKISKVFDHCSKHIQFEQAQNLVDSASRLQILIGSKNNLVNSEKSQDETSNLNKELVEEEIDIDERANEDQESIDTSDIEEDDYPVEEMENTIEEITILDKASNKSCYDDENDVDATSSESSDEDSNFSDTDSEEDEEAFGDIDVDRSVELKRMQQEYKNKLNTDEERKAIEDFNKQFDQFVQESMDERKTEKSATDKIPVIAQNQ